MYSIISSEQTTGQLMQIAMDGKESLSEMDRSLLVEILKERGHRELDYGEELTCGSIRLVKRVTGNVSLFFGNK
ncbi:MAG: hypothetical protein IPM23_17985 [Candidatus Melainabacteria bacterium]|nr:hypothetical protein [Candidatus Melainabacteria bacterium]